MSSNRFSKVLILTSCISPNTFSGKISDFTSEKRAKELIRNCLYVIKKQLFDKIIIIDASPRNSLPKDINLASYLSNLGLTEQKDIDFIEFRPSQDIQILIEEKGKGFSETKMILNVLENLEYSERTIFFKLSGRYLIKNIENVISYIESFFNNGVDFAIPVSDLFFKTNSVMYAFSSSFKIEKFEEISKKISENDGLYVEHLLYSEVFLNSFINTLRMTKVLPIYPNDQEGGSCQGNYTFWRQLIKNLIYKYF